MLDSCDLVALPERMLRQATHSASAERLAEVVDAVDTRGGRGNRARSARRRGGVAQRHCGQDWLD